MDAKIKTATERDLKTILAIQKQHPNALGFIPAAGIEEYARRGLITLALENGDKAGYLLQNSHLRWNIAMRPIIQAAIFFDAQRRHHGLALVAAAAADARAAGQIAIQAMCREGLEANVFWKIAGFEEIGRYQPQNARQKQMICWRLQLTRFRPAWFDIMPTHAGWKAKKISRRQIS